MGEMYHRWLYMLFVHASTICPNNVVCLTQGCFCGGSASIVKGTRRQSSCNLSLAKPSMIHFSHRLGLNGRSYEEEEAFPPEKERAS